VASSFYANQTGRPGCEPVRRVTSLAIPAFWLLRRGLYPSMIKACPHATARSIRFLSHNSYVGPHLLARLQNHCLANINNHSVTNPVSRTTVQSLKHPWSSRCNGAHSGDWLLALPIANCGLKLEDEAVRVAVEMRLGLSLCVPHKCRCGSTWMPKAAMLWSVKRHL